MSCVHHFDADDVARAMRGEMPAASRVVFDVHIDDCASCKASARILNQVKEVWQRGIARDEAFAGRAREQRLMSAGFLPRMKGARARFALVGAAAGALAMLVWSAQRSHELPPQAAVSSSSAAPAPALASASSAAQASSAVQASTSPARRPQVVALSACASCTRGGAGRSIAEGAIFAPNEEVRIPDGGFLSLAWGIDATALEEPSQVDVEGPAVVSSSPASPASPASPPALLVSRGVAHAQAGHARVLRTTLATSRGDHAAWTLDAQSDRTHIDVARGTVHVEASGPRHASADVAPGDPVDVLPDGTIAHRRGAIAAPSTSGPRAPFAVSPASGSVPLVAAAPPSADALLWQRSEDALERGDRSAAEAALHALLEPGTPSAFHDRAVVRLAQLELARGDRDDARALLSSLVRGQDRAIAADAALLLARSTTSPSERAAVWRDYLRTAPPSPYRQQASVEQATALLDAGDHEAARAIADTLHSDPSLPEVVRASLARLDARLAPSP